VTRASSPPGGKAPGLAAQIGDAVSDALPWVNAVFMSSVSHHAGTDALVLGLEDQRRESGDVWRGHRRAADRVVTAELLVPARLNRSVPPGPPRSRLETELGIGSERAEVGDHGGSCKGVSRTWSVQVSRVIRRGR